MADEHWNRRELDAKSKKELLAKIEDLDGRLEDGLDKLREDFDKKLSDLSDDNEKLRAMVSAIGTTVHGDGILGRGSLKDLAKIAVQDAAAAKKDAEEARRIVEGRSRETLTLRGQNIPALLSVLSIVSVAVLGVIVNLDKIKANLRRETPEEKVERIRQEIDELKKTRGPIVDKKLRDMEREAKKFR